MSEGTDEQVLGEQSLPRQFRCTNLEMTVNLDVITLPMQFYTRKQFLGQKWKKNLKLLIFFLSYHKWQLNQIFLFIQLKQIFLFIQLKQIFLFIQFKQIFLFMDVIYYFKIEIEFQHFLKRLLIMFSYWSIGSPFLFKMRNYLNGWNGSKTSFWANGKGNIPLAQ